MLDRRGDSDEMDLAITTGVEPDLSVGSTTIRFIFPTIRGLSPAQIDKARSYERGRQTTKTGQEMSYNTVVSCGGEYAWGGVVGEK